MGSFSIWHILVVVIVVMLLFGKGRLSGTMEDLAHGIKAFKKGMKEDNDIGVPPSPGASMTGAMPPARPGELPPPEAMLRMTETDKTTLPPQI